jgi:hypothetical protein
MDHNFGERACELVRQARENTSAKPQHLANWLTETYWLFGDVVGPDILRISNKWLIGDEWKLAEIRLRMTEFSVADDEKKSIEMLKSISTKHNEIAALCFVLTRNIERRRNRADESVEEAKLAKRLEIDISKEMCEFPLHDKSGRRFTIVRYPDRSVGVWQDSESILGFDWEEFNLVNAVEFVEQNVINRV